MLISSPTFHVRGYKNYVVIHSKTSRRKAIIRPLQRNIRKQGPILYFHFILNYLGLPFYLTCSDYSFILSFIYQCYRIISVQLGRRQSQKTQGCFLSNIQQSVKMFTSRKRHLMTSENHNEPFDKCTHSQAYCRPLLFPSYISKCKPG